MGQDVCLITSDSQDQRFLMYALMDAVHYDFPPGETVVRLEKQFTPR